MGGDWVGVASFFIGNLVGVVLNNYSIVVLGFMKRFIFANEILARGSCTLLLISY